MQGNCTFMEEKVEQQIEYKINTCEITSLDSDTWIMKIIAYIGQNSVQCSEIGSPFEATSEIFSSHNRTEIRDQ